MTVTVITDKFGDVFGVAENNSNAIVNLLINAGKVNQFTRIISREAAPLYPHIIALGDVTKDWETWLRNQSVLALQRLFYEFSFDTFKLIKDYDKRY